MPVARRSTRSRDEIDEDEEPEEERRPRRRRARDEDEEPEEKPRKRRAARDEDEDDEDERPAKRRRARDDDDDDEKPRRRSSTGSVRKGWKGAKENASKSSDYPDDLKITGEPELVKFLEDEPFVSYRQHWVDNPPNGIRKKSWTCLEDDCPLCDLGDRPRTLTCFNVLHISNGGDPDVKVLTLGNKALGQLEGYATDPKTGPLTRLYWAVSKSGKGQSTAYNFRPVKERDLDEDWEITVDEVEDAIDDAEGKVYDETSVQIPTKKQLREIAAGLADDDEYDDD